jgi:hypothetical protein
MVPIIAWLFNIVISFNKNIPDKRFYFNGNFQQIINIFDNWKSTIDFTVSKVI